MIYAQNVQSFVILKQESATNGATLTSVQVDTLGYDYCKITLVGTTSNNATNKPATLRVTESDDTVLTNFAAVTALVGGGTGGFTIPNSPTATTTAPYAVFNIDTRYRKRYLTLEVSPVTTQTFMALAQLSRAGQVPSGTAATSENAAVIVYG